MATNTTFAEIKAFFPNQNLITTETDEGDTFRVSLDRVTNLSSQHDLVGRRIILTLSRDNKFVVKAELIAI